MAERYYNFFRSLDETDIRIIKAIEAIGPRNILNIARLAGVTPGAIYPRIRRFKKLGTWVYALVKSSFFGLSSVLVLAEEVPRRGRLVREALTTIPYIRYLARCYGSINGWCVTYAVPRQHVTELRDYLFRMVERGLVRKLEIYEVTGFEPFLPDFSYYNPKSKSWNFDWDKWLASLENGSFGEFNFPEVAFHSNKAFDKLDIEICAYLDKNSFMRIVELAKILNKPVSTIKYRYDRLIKKGVIKKHVVLVLPFPPATSDMILARFVCERLDLLKRLAAGFTHTPYIASITKVIGQNAMFVHLYMPKPDLLNFFRVILRLAEGGYIRDYSFVILLTETAKSWGIPSKLYNDKSGWEWDYARYIKSLNEIIRRA